MAGGGTATLFGQVLYLQNQSGAIVFIAVLVVFTLFEGVLHVIEVECAKRGFKGLIKKLYREFMIMGFISFAILIATEAYSSPDGIWYNAFNFAHLVLLFIGLTFLVQSGTLAALINSRNRTLLAHDNSTSEDLIIQYIDLHKKGGIMRLLFEHGPVSIPVPELREKIEYKIIQEFFIRNYNLPREFRFANYMCMVLKNYVLSLVEVRPINWVILASFVAINYGRIAVIDPIYETAVCDKYPNKDLHRDGFESRRTLFEDNDNNFVTPVLNAVTGAVSDIYNSYYHVDNLTEEEASGDMRILAGGGDDKGDDDEDYGRHVCTEYMLRYVFVCTMLLVLYLVGVLIATEIYMQRLIEKVLDQEETIEWLEEEEDREVLRQVKNNAPAADNGYTVKQTIDDTCNNAAKTDTTASSANGTTGDFPRPRARRLTAAHRIGSLYTNGAAMYTAEELPDGTLVGPAAARRLSVYQRLGSMRQLDGENDVLGPNNNTARGLNASSGSERMRSRTVDASHYYGSISNSVDIHDTVPVDLENGEDILKSTPKDHRTSFSPTGESSPVKSTGRRRMTTAQMRSMSLRSDNGVEMVNPSAIPANSHSPIGPLQRRMTHHRMGSLQSDHAIGLTSGGSDRQRRMESLRSDTSEHDALNERNYFWNFFSNRRFLYLGCLERIMNEEFDFHANEAKRMSIAAGQEDAEDGGELRDSGASTATMSSHRHSFDSLEELPLKQANRQRRSLAPDMVPIEEVDGHDEDDCNDSSRSDLNSGNINMESKDNDSSKQLSLDDEHLQGGSSRKRSNTTGSTKLSSQRPLSHNLVPHQNMISNFQMMKDLRDEMLHATSDNHQLKRKSFFGSFFHSDPHDNGKEASDENDTVINSATLPPHRSTIASYVDSVARLEGDVEEPYTELVDGIGRTYSLQYLKAPELLKSENLGEMEVETPSFIQRLKLLPFWLWSGFKYVALSGASVILGHHLGLAESDISPDDDVAMMQKDFSTIFLFCNAEIYYGTVELALLIQCVYLALWATNFVIVALESYYPILWNIALVVPLPINFFILKHIIFTSAMVKSIVTLDKYVSDKICEEAVDVQNVTQRVRKAVRHALRSMEIPKEQWYSFTRQQFSEFIPPNDRGLNVRNLKLFLHSMQIFLTEKSIARIFSVLDFDRSGKVTWNDIFPVIFPDLQRKQLQVKARRRSSHNKTFNNNTATKGRRRESILQQRSSLVLQASINTDLTTEDIIPMDDSTPDSRKMHKKEHSLHFQDIYNEKPIKKAVTFGIEEEKKDDEIEGPMTIDNDHDSCSVGNEDINSASSVSTDSDNNV